MDVPAYCARMRRAGEWGGAIELLVFSRLARVSVLVYERDAADEFRLISAFENAERKGATQPRLVRVLYSGRCHYDALKA